LRKLVNVFDNHWVVLSRLFRSVLGLRIEPLEDRMISEFAWTL
jgi:hypothetical protein